jgi:hypothetical protein
MQLALRTLMKFICRHCDALTVGTAYRVVSEEAGVILLDMIVCHACFIQARNLGLQTEEITSDASHRLRAFG